MSSFRDLKVWQFGIEISLEVYRVTSEFPQHELYGLTNQLRRAAVSVPSNIAEGQARKSNKELARYVNIAKGSLAEIETQLIIADKLGYLENGQADALLTMTDEESRMLSGLLSSLQR
jgi:four helix bundle protein